MVAFSTVKAGDVLYDVQRQRAGNTTMYRAAVYEVRVIERHDGHAIVSWNGNAPKKYLPRNFEKLRRSKPKGE